MAEWWEPVRHRVCPLQGLPGKEHRHQSDDEQEHANPNRISKVWVRHRVEEVIAQLSTVCWMTAKSKTWCRRSNAKG